MGMGTWLLGLLLEQLLNEERDGERKNKLDVNAFAMDGNHSAKVQRKGAGRKAR